MKSPIIFSEVRAEMARSNLSTTEMAESLGISNQTLINKLSGRTPIYLNEAVSIQRIFFPHIELLKLFKELNDSKTNE